MNTITYRTVLSRSSAWARGLTLATLAAGAWALSAGQVHARDGNDVYWSIGVHQPGVSVGVSNAPPPRPVIIHQSAPVIIHQPYPYLQPVVVHQPYPYVRPVVVHPRPVYYSGWRDGPRWDDRKRWKKHHRQYHDRHWDDDDRDERRGGDRRR
ncbi:MAG: hypothetical protein C0443_13510 [Comamonadaceae bacterium]|nr:hypothetical protein [Comamonadaceae bacterium]